MTITDGEIVDLTTPTGPMRTHILKPSAAGRYPGVILFSEIFQVTAPVRRTGAMLAGHGLVVAIPEIYHEFEAPGTAFAYDEAGGQRGGKLKTTKELGAFDADARAVIAHLESRADCTGRLGAMGLCIGGHLAFRAAMNPQIRSASCLYATEIHRRGLGKGASDDTLDRMGEIKGEVCMIWGLQDTAIPREGRQLIYNRMAESGVKFTWHEVNGQHAFLRDEGPRYDPELARFAYALTIDLFHRTLAS